MLVVVEASTGLAAFGFNDTVTAFPFPQGVGRDAGKAGNGADG